MGPTFLGRWVRSYMEQVEGGGQVYRREEHPLPPARGRAAVEIHPDGTFIDARIGPIEGSPPAIAQWDSTDGTTGDVDIGGNRLLTFTVEDMEDGSARLVVRRPGASPH